MKSIVVPNEITEMCMIPVKKSKTSHLLLVALCDGKQCCNVEYIVLFCYVLFCCVIKASNPYYFYFIVIIIITVIIILIIIIILVSQPLVTSSPIDIYSILPPLLSTHLHDIFSHFLFDMLQLLLLVIPFKSVSSNATILGTLFLLS